MQVILNIPDDLSQKLAKIRDINQFAAKWFVYGLENTKLDKPLDITAAFGLIKTTQTATLEQIQQALQEGATDDNN